jgi:cell division transport system ATP-binding protein
MSNPVAFSALDHELNRTTENSTSKLVEELLAQTAPATPVTVSSASSASLPPLGTHPIPVQISVPAAAAAPASAIGVAATATGATQTGATQTTTLPSLELPRVEPVLSPSQTAVQPVAQPATQPAVQSSAPSAVQPAPQPAQPTAQSSAPARPLTQSTPVIVFDKVSKTYPAQPNKPALSNISLQIYTGDFIFLVGHSGSGKSTFIRLLNREIVATKGKLMVAGEDIVRMRNWRVPYLRRNIGCVFQDFKLLPNKTAFENVAFALEVIGKSKHIIRTQVPEVLRLVGLEDKLDKVPDQLSGGEQQRVSIARAIVNRPPLLICDEPTGNLDPQTSLGIMRLLDRINRTGTTILVATHDREMVDSLRKRVVELENGYLVRDQDKGVYGIDA